MRMNDDAVSAVVSAVLVFSLFSTAFVMFTVISLPEWIADREQAHQDGVLGDLHGIEADLEALSGADDRGPVQTSIDLQPTPVTLLQRAPARASIAFVDGTNITGTFSGATVHMLNGETRGTPSEPANGFSATGVQELLGMSLALQSRLQGVGGDADITMAFTSATGTITATLLHTENPTGCNQNEIRFDVDGSQRILLCDASDDMSAAYRFDPLVPGNGLRAALGSIGTPFDVSVSSSGAVSATLSAVWNDHEGRLQAVGSGAASTFALQETGGHVVVEANPQHHTPQHMVWDAGGVGLVQGDGQAIREAANLELVQGSDRYLQWTLVDLDGTPSEHSGDRAILRVEHTGTTEVLLQVDSAQISLTTPYADAWLDLLETTRLAAGADEASTSSDGSQVTLGLTGSDPWWVHLRIIHAEVTVS